MNGGVASGASHGTVRRFFVGGTVLSLALVAPVPLAGQELVPKGLENPVQQACGAIAALGTGASEGYAVPRVAVDSLLTAGNQAAILGENIIAREYFQQAADLDPFNAVVAYRLARTLDDLGEGDAAVQEYCRYLRLTPPERDAITVRSRIEFLASAPAPDSQELWAASMSDGLRAYQDGRYRDAVGAFTRVIELRPDWPDPYFNRALAYGTLGQPSAAAHDLATYLSLAPEAQDAALVRSEIERLGAPEGLQLASSARPITMVSPGNALAQGLIIPGLGQHATGRTGLGIFVLSAAAGAVYYGMREQVVVRREGARDPFGNPYEYEVRSVERPHQFQGIGAAVAIAFAGAIESYVYASRVQRRSRMATRSLVPTVPRGPSPAASLPGPLAGTASPAVDPSSRSSGSWSNDCAREAEDAWTGGPVRSCGRLMATSTP